MGFDAIVSGDSIITQRISKCTNEDFRQVIDLFREADISHTHFETITHNFDGPEVYPAAEAGGNWLRSPLFVAEEFKWAGFDIVSHAGNHCLDYSYGGLRSTWKTLDKVGIPYAGTGENLADAREPAFLDTEKARVGLVSMTPSFQRWARAGEQRNDVKGRPGVNPLRTHFEAGPEEMEQIIELAKRFGMWITRIGEDRININPPGIHNTIYRFVESDEPGIRQVLNERDAAGNLRSIRSAKMQADFAIAHIHTHEHDPDGDVSTPPTFLEDYARNCVEAGADIVVCQGSHAPARGIEIYEGTPIFYDPGDLFFQSDTVERIPAEFYYRHQHDLDQPPREATPPEAFAARGLVYPWGGQSSVTQGDGNINSFGKGDNLLAPPNGFFVGPGSFVPVCAFDDDFELEKIRLHPTKWIEAPTSVSGVPARAHGAEAEEIIVYIDDLSNPYGVSINYEDETGVISL